MDNPRGRLIKSARTMLTALISIDNRHAFSPPGHWLIAELPLPVFREELRREQEKVPPTLDRAQVFLFFLFILFFGGFFF